MKSDKLASIVVLAMVAACGGGGGMTPGPTSSIAQAPSSGDGQHAAVTAELDQPLLVKVTKNDTPLAGSDVTWSTNSAGVVLTPGGPTGADGIASVTVTFGTVAGPDTIRASLGGSAGSPVRFIVFADPGPATKLAYQVAPSNVLHDAVITPVVKVVIQDALGNKVGATNPVTIAIGTNPAAGTLSGGGPISAVAGVASFPALKIDAVGDGYTLTASAPGLTSVTANPFNVTATPPLPTAIGVTVGTGIQFRSARNGTANPAIDTLAVGGTVTWTKSGGSHNVESTGSPSFASSYAGNPSTTVMGSSYAVIFNTAGTYQYDCGIHGIEMTGRVVVK